MKTISGNILDVENGLIVHQVNTLGVAGGGLALQIRQRYPAWYSDYHNYCAIKPKLGTVTYFEVKEGLFIVNLFGQNWLGVGATDYNSYDIALPQIKDLSNNLNFPVYFPYKIGCGLGGGNWLKIEAKIEKYIPYSIIVKFEG